MEYASVRREGYAPTGAGLRLFYRQLGNGPDVIIVPSESWLSADFERLATPNRTWVFFDTRGRGASDSVTDVSQVQAGYELEDIEAVCQYLGIEQMDLLGWSIFGTRVAQYAATYPDRVSRLVMMCPGNIRNDAPYLDPEAAMAKANARMDPIGVARLDEMKKAGLDFSQPEMYCKEHRRAYLVRQMGKPQALANMKSNPCRYESEWPRNLVPFFQKVATQGSYDWRQEAASIQAPTLVIHGAEDLIPEGSAREWAEAIPNAQLLSIPGAGHYPHLEAPEVLFAAVDDFLASP